MDYCDNLNVNWIIFDTCDWLTTRMHVSRMTEIDPSLKVKTDNFEIVAFTTGYHAYFMT